MAKTSTDAAAVSKQLISEIKAGQFRPVYILMGEEPYYPELVCKTIIDNCIDECEKDFNETICFGADVNAEMVISAARRFPMMSDRQLVVVKEAQMMKDIEALTNYLKSPLDTTVLVLLLRKAKLDERKSLYKEAKKCAAVLYSAPIKDYAISNWISAYYREKGLDIDPKAAMLLGESTGTELSVIVGETEKLLKNLPEGATKVSVEDIERNVGISRQFSIFELTKALSSRNASKALTLAAHIGNAASFNMPAAITALYTHFSRILKYSALASKGSVSPSQKAQVLVGVNPYFYPEYDTAIRNYPLPKAMAAIALLCEYDYLGKGGDGAASSPDQLLLELIAKLLNL